MDQNNMNKFFNSSFFAQTPQKDNKQGTFSSGQQQQAFGLPQPQPGFGVGSGLGNFMQNTGVESSGSGTKGGIFGNTSMFGSREPNKNNGFGQAFSGQSPSVFGRLGTSSSAAPGNSNNTAFGAVSGGHAQSGAPFGSAGNMNPFSTTQSSTFNSGFQGSGVITQPFLSGGSNTASAQQQPSMWGQQGTPQTAYNPFTGVQGDKDALFGKSSFPGLGMNTGTRDHAYVQRKIREDSGGDVILMHINGNENYTGKSIEELRSEDYILGRKPSAAGNTMERRSFAGFGGNKLFETNQTQPQIMPDSKNLGAGISNSGFQGVSNRLQYQPSSFQKSYGFGPQPSSFDVTTTPAAFQPSFQNFTSGNTPPISSTPSQFQISSGMGAQNTNPSFQPISTEAQLYPLKTSAFPQQSFQQTGFPSEFMPSQTMQPSVFGQGMMTQMANPQQQRVDLSDPFLLRDIKFEIAEKEHIPLCKIFPLPIFKEEQKQPKISLNFRPPKSPIREEVYTVPSIEDIKHMKEVHNLVIGFECKGRIEYLDTVNAADVTIAAIQSKIYFSKKSVVINDPVGIGLNKRARVHVEGVFPYSRRLGDFVRGKQEEFPSKGVQERFIHELKNDPVKKFVEYECERGTYIYDVNHF